MLGLHSGSIGPREDGGKGRARGGDRERREKRQLVLNHHCGEMRYGQMGGAGRKHHVRMNERGKAGVKSCLTLRPRAVQRKRLTAFNASGWTSAQKWH